MSKLRGLLFLCAIIVLAGGWLSAQEKKADDKTPPAKAKGTLPSNWKKLGLTDEQVQQVYRIQTEYREKIGTFEGKIKGLKDEEKTAMDKVLTDTQKARLKELKTGEATTKDDKKPTKDDKKP